MALSTRNRKRKQLGDGVAPFEFLFQTQKIKRVSRVFETQQNLAVEKKPTTSLPLRKGLSPKQVKTIPLASSPRKHRKSEELGFDGLCLTQKIKRQKLGFEFDCSEILGCMMNLIHVSSYFEKPVVDPVYLRYIWRPMDFGTVKSKLERGVYSSPDGFAADVRLTLSNALRYYPSGRIERAEAKHLSSVFESKWKEALEKNPKSVCPSHLPKVKGLAVLPKQGKTSSPSSVLESKGLGVSDSQSVDSTKHYELATLVDNAMDQASESLSQCKAVRIHALKLRFSGTILKANKILKGVPDSPPRRKSMQRMKQRESARRAISNMKKSVQFEDPLQDLKQLEMLCGCGSEDPFLQVHLGLPLKKLGVFLREDDELQGQDEEAFLNGRWEEGEICY
ncbi:transcription factor GTE12-like [Prunus yedoensis var. nudiflora]|uniref:Transcription factor GTE12-like n=1 Tax=Prunus yedoensis var. nudiflora TaxID=2094558 RepID=A0A314Z2D0_PRUYE|nr:transcription factor GTE12-like [Prunus yedoensis var. nudiflora]